MLDSSILHTQLIKDRSKFFHQTYKELQFYKVQSFMETSYVQPFRKHLLNHEAC